MSVHQLFDLGGQTALVTGAASGLGSAIAEALLAAGARTLMTDVDEDALNARVALLRKQHPLAEGAVLDVADPDAVDAVVDDAVRRYGQLDCVFANAGISAGRGFAVEAGQLEHVERPAWDRVMRINLDGVLATLRASVRHMKPRRQGRIIVTSSIAGIRAAGFKTDQDFSDADMRRLNIKRGPPIEDPEKPADAAARLKRV